MQGGAFTGSMLTFPGFPCKHCDMFSLYRGEISRHDALYHELAAVVEGKLRFSCLFRLTYHYQEQVRLMNKFVKS